MTNVEKIWISDFVFAKEPMETFIDRTKEIYSAFKTWRTDRFELLGRHLAILGKMQEQKIQKEIESVLPNYKHEWGFFDKIISELRYEGFEIEIKENDEFRTFDILPVEDVLFYCLDEKKTKIKPDLRNMEIDKDALKRNGYEILGDLWGDGAVPVIRICTTTSYTVKKKGVKND